jgi:pyruvate kinase
MAAQGENAHVEFRPNGDFAGCTALRSAGKVGRMNRLLDLTDKLSRNQPTNHQRPDTDGRATVPTGRRTRIVATLGPASADVETIRRMCAAGMDVARFNFSHGSHEFHRRLAGVVRQVAAESGRPVLLMQDLQGPKLRIGTLPGGSIDLIDGTEVEVRFASASNDLGVVPVPHRELVRALEPRDRLLLGDGEMELSVLASRGDAAWCAVLRGGRLGERKGISLPGRYFPTPLLTRKDRNDLAFGRSLGFDLLALSFVRTASDLTGVRSLTRELGWEVPLVAKLETQEALLNLDDILVASDAVMVARGDLGVQLSLAAVPAAQKEIISRANQARVPVITATQMLESMVTSSRPTRAEATDVANAVWDGTDAVMLSAETSAGTHPAEAITAMSEFCLAAESNDAWRRGVGAGWHFNPQLALVAEGVAR